MIFVTVGAQMPFDRMVRAIDAWAAQRNRRDVFAQIGPDAFKPQHIEWTEFLAPAEFRARCQSADMLVAHAGMGSILSALELGKPIIVMPRRGDLRETRNDHQVATAQRLGERPGVCVALDENELQTKLDTIDELAGGQPIAAQAQQTLIDAVREFIEATP